MQPFKCASSLQCVLRLFRFRPAQGTSVRIKMLQILRVQDVCSILREHGKVQAYLASAQLTANRA